MSLQNDNSELSANSPSANEAQSKSVEKILLEFSNGAQQANSLGSHSSNDFFNPPKAELPQLPKISINEHKQNLPQRSHQNQADLDRRALAMEQEMRTILFASIHDGPDLNEFDSGLFEAINNWRTSHGLSELEYDDDLRDMAVANNNKMTQKGLGHWAYGGYEVAGWNYGTPEATLNGWLNSPGHYKIVSNPNLRKMGPAGDPTWQTVHFS